MRADALVLFGATGDLSKRKLFPALYAMARNGRLDVPIIGVARSDWHDEEFRAHATESILTAVPEADPVIIADICSRLHLVTGDYAELATFDGIVSTLSLIHISEPTRPY